MGRTILPGAPYLSGSVPVTWVTVYTGDMGNTLGLRFIPARWMTCLYRENRYHPILYSGHQEHGGPGRRLSPRFGHSPYLNFPHYGNRDVITVLAGEL